VLLQQRHLQRIELEAANEADQVMTAVREGPGRTLRSLWVSPHNADAGRGRICGSVLLPDAFFKSGWDSAGRHVGACLGAGGCPVLEFEASKRNSVCAVVRGLVGRVLELHLRHMTPACGDALAAVLAGGAIPNLRHLKLYWNDIDGAGSAPLHAVAMAMVLRASPRPKLRALVMTFHGQRAPDDEGVVAIVDALRAEPYRGLTTFKLCFTGFPRPFPEWGLEALGEALLDCAWPHLESLDTHCTPPALARLTDALRWGMLPCLKHLKLKGAFSQGVDVEVGVAVGGALRAGRYPRLETLEIQCGNEGCGEIARAMEEGALPCLKALKLSDCRLTREAGQALVRALEGGAGASLTEIRVDLDCYATWVRLRATVAVACPKMRTAQITAKYID
jgi:hypothetical protein